MGNHLTTLSKDEITSDILSKLGISADVYSQKGNEIEVVINDFYLRFTNIISDANSDISKDLKRIFCSGKQTCEYHFGDISETIKKEYFEKASKKIAGEKRIMIIKIHNIISPDRQFYIPKYINTHIIDLQEYIIDLQEYIFIEYEIYLVPAVLEYLKPFYDKVALTFEEIDSSFFSKLQEIEKTSVPSTESYKKKMKLLSEEYMELVNRALKKAQNDIDSYFQNGQELY